MKMKRFFLIAVLTIVSSGMILCFLGCNKQTDDITLRFTAPEGTPALAMTKLVVDNKKINKYDVQYEIVSPANIVAEMKSNKSDLIIMPINAGATSIRQGSEYKLISIAVNGSLFMVGNGDAEEISLNEVIGKKIACIGQNAVPGMVFRYILAQNGINISTSETPNALENEAYVQYVADGNAAKTLLANNSVDYAVVGEPAATAIKNALNITSEMDLQKKYSETIGANDGNYPQAGLFIKKTLLSDENFINDLFVALKSSKDWVLANPNEVTQFAKTNLYESAVFPTPSISRCAINVERLTDASKKEIIDFLNIIVNKDENGNDLDWNLLTETLF